MFGDLNKKNPHFKDEYRAIKADAPPPKDPPFRGNNNSMAVGMIIWTALKMLDKDFRFGKPEANRALIQRAGAKMTQAADLVSPAFQSKYLRPWLADIQKMLATDDPGIWYQTARMLVYEAGEIVRPMIFRGGWPKGTEPKKGEKSVKANADLKQIASQLNATASTARSMYNFAQSRGPVSGKTWYNLGKSIRGLMVYQSQASAVQHSSARFGSDMQHLAQMCMTMASITVGPRDPEDKRSAAEYKKWLMNAQVSKLKLITYELDSWASSIANYSGVPEPRDDEQPWYYNTPGGRG